MKYSRAIFSQETLTSLRLRIFIASILIYAFFSYPTPDNPGLAELFIGLGLVASLGFSPSAFALLTSRFAEPLWMKPARILLIYGLSAPLFMALINGNEMGDLLRDIIPFLFLLLPFFTYDLFQKLPPSREIRILTLVLLAGIIFALRGAYVLKDGASHIDNLDALYLVNAPTVLFAALCFSGYAIKYISLRKPFLPFCAAIISLLPMAAMGMVLQRASFGALTLNGLFLSTGLLKNSLLRFLYLIAAGIITLFILQDYVWPLLENLFEKNRAVGSNMRLYELQAVWERVADSSISALFGQGWGGTVQSPAVGGLTVNYTHSLISAFLLKTGLVGTLLIISFLGALFLRFPALYKASPLLALALFWPFAIDIFLYASYKSLDFGLILMLIANYGLPKNQNWLESKPQNINDQQSVPADEGRNGSFIA